MKYFIVLSIALFTSSFSGNLLFSKEINSKTELYKNTSFENDETITTVYQGKNGKIQKRYKQIIKKYDANGMLTERISNDWNKKNKSWVTTQRHIYTYDINNRLDKISYTDSKNNTKCSIVKNGYTPNINN